MAFARTRGIDYSGTETPTASLAAFTLHRTLDGPQQKPFYLRKPST